MIIISLMYVKNILISFCKTSVLAVSMALLAACEHHILPEPHKIDIEQGNAISQEEFESLYTGMTQKEVADAVGAPMLVDPFHVDRWDYIYRLKPGKGRERHSRFTLYFRDGILVKIDGEDYKEY
jgi:outer membrane protein assembly factor BamE